MRKMQARNHTLGNFIVIKAANLLFVSSSTTEIIKETTINLQSIFVYILCRLKRKRQKQLIASLFPATEKQVFELFFKNGNSEKYLQT